MLEMPGDLGCLPVQTRVARTPGLCQWLVSVACVSYRPYQVPGLSTVWLTLEILKWGLHSISHDFHWTREQCEAGCGPQFPKVDKWECWGC